MSKAFHLLDEVSNQKYMLKRQFKISLNSNFLIGRETIGDFIEDQLRDYMIWTIEIKRGRQNWIQKIVHIQVLCSTLKSHA